MVTTAGPSRRTIYGLVDRQNLPGLFRTFDFASPDATAPKRFETTVPQQALYMMNSPFVTAQAEKLANEAGRADDPETIRRLYRAILAREPEPQEIELALACLKDLAAQPRQTGTAWQNGWGSFDPATLTTTFTPFPFYQENRWSPSSTVPDPQLGFVHLTREGGHPGSDAARSAIRRWAAPADGIVDLSGSAVLQQKQSGGITAFIFHSRLGLLGTWPVPPDGKIETALSKVEVKTGETLDFILDCQGDPNSDTFQWSPVIRDAMNNATLADAAKDFGGPGASALAAYAQVLLCSNEFLYLD